MKKNRIRIGFGDVSLFLLSLILLTGSRTIFAPCTPKTDGTYMSCHWVGITVTGIAAALTVISLFHLFTTDKGIKTGLDLSVIPIAVFTALIPEHLIQLCMLNHMRCNSIMRPCVVILAVLLIFTAVCNLLFCDRKK